VTLVECKHLLVGGNNWLSATALHFLYVIEAKLEVDCNKSFRCLSTVL